MAQTWAGPAVTKEIVGTVDSFDSEAPSDYGKNRCALSLVDVIQKDSNGVEMNLEARTLYFAADGQPADAFAASARLAFGLKAGDDIIAPLLKAGRITLAVEQKAFESKKDGRKGTMTIYRIVGNNAVATEKATDAEVLTFLAGKTPAEVSRARGSVAGWADVLVSRTKVQAHFGDKVKLVEGKYQVS